MYGELRNRVSRASNAPRWRPKSDSLGAVEGDGPMLRRSLETLLESTFQDGEGNESSGAMAIAAAMFDKALRGDVRAFIAIRDTCGEQPTARTAIEDSRISPEVYEEVARLLELGEGEE